MSFRKFISREIPLRLASTRWHPRGFIVAMSVLLALAALVFGAACAGVSIGTTTEDQLQKADGTEAVASSPTLSPALPSYPIGGYFITASSRDATNKKKLEDIRALGGDTVVTFGTPLQPVTLESIPKDCQVDGKNCARVAANSLSVDRYFTFLDGSNWNTSALKCPNDRKVTNNGQSYSVLVLPKVGQGCTSSDGHYDVVVVGGSSSTATDPSSSLAAAATKLDMEFYAGLPAPVRGLELSYLPDGSYQETLAAFTERFLAYHAANNDFPGLAGFYHHTEMPLTDSAAFDSILSLYRSQNQAIHRVLPTRKAIVSPYIDSRVGSGISPERARNGIRRIAQTSGGLQLNIAIQDGMGTGKGGAFGHNEASSAVDSFAATIVGEGAWGTKYLAPNKDYFSAAAEGISGTGAVLWANVEGMAPAAKDNSCLDSRRGQTSKARLDRQLQQVASARKIISFMWDSYFTCRGAGTPLKEQIESGVATPIVTDTTFNPKTGRVDITGFNLKGSSASVKWTSRDGKYLEKSAKASRFDATYGAKRGLHPNLEMVSVDLGSSTLATAQSYSLAVTNEWGSESTDYLSRLP